MITLAFYTITGFKTYELDKSKKLLPCDVCRIGDTVLIYLISMCLT